MLSANKVLLIGNLARDPEFRDFQNGGRMARIAIATNSRYRDRETNEMKESVQFHNVVVFNENIVKIIENHARKGTQVMVEGQLETRSWTAEDGSKRYATEVVLRAFNSTFQLGSRPGGNNGSGDGAGSDDNGSRGWNSGNEQGSAQDQGSGGSSNYDDDLDADVPF